MPVVIVQNDRAADVADCKTIRFAKLTYEAQRLYPGLDASFWHPVIDGGCLAEGVILKVRGGGRFVWKHHVRLRDLPTPYVRPASRG